MGFLTHNCNNMNKMKEVKERQREERKGNEKGLYLLHTGNGKGKTSAAMNMVYRHLAHDMPVAVVQFIKQADDFPDGDRKMLLKLKELGLPVNILTFGAGFSWNADDSELKKKAALDAFAKALAFLKDGSIKLVLLDEIHIAIKQGHIDAQDVLEGVAARAPMTHVITTGRHAPEILIEAADLVTEMKPIKHHVSQKIPAQIGIEF